ncbi:MAG: STAS domain-containing protein [Clostridia bacterium]|nr:STAS domain-containing protein [Clostridia bacterium]
MTVSYNEDRGKLEIELFGELGHHEAIEAIDNIAALYECIMPVELILDMGGISFMDSSGIAVVMRAKRLCDTDGIAMAVKNAPRQALKVLSAAGITRLVSFI